MIVFIYTDIPDVDDAFEKALKENLAGRKLPSVQILKITDNSNAEYVLNKKHKPSAVVIRLGDSEKSQNRMRFVSLARLHRIPTIVISKHVISHRMLAQTCKASFVKVHSDDDIMNVIGGVANSIAFGLQTHADDVARLIAQ